MRQPIRKIFNAAHKLPSIRNLYSLQHLSTNNACFLELYDSFLPGFPAIIRLTHLYDRRPYSIPRKYTAHCLRHVPVCKYCSLIQEELNLIMTSNPGTLKRRYNTVQFEKQAEAKFGVALRKMPPSAHIPSINVGSPNPNVKKWKSIMLLMSAYIEPEYDALIVPVTCIKEILTSWRTPRYC
jgi:hypothetical protein